MCVCTTSKASKLSTYTYVSPESAAHPAYYYTSKASKLSTHTSSMSSVLSLLALLVVCFTSSRLKALHIQHTTILVKQVN
jgi:hypothetical protein